MGATFRFLLMDGPAHGKSEGGEAEFTMEACAQAMGQMMDHVGLDHAIVGGTSWGGLVAANLALAAPHRAEALVLLNTPMEVGAARPGLKAHFIASGARWMLRSSVFRHGVAKSFFTPDVLRANPDYAHAFHAMLASAEPTRLAAAMLIVSEK
ncbi:MAG: alpha/beta fold hydrolase [Pseudomonadota bacterium]